MTCNNVLGSVSKSEWEALTASCVSSHPCDPLCKSQTLILVSGISQSGLGCNPVHTWTWRSRSAQTKRDKSVTNNPGVSEGADLKKLFFSYFVLFKKVRGRKMSRVIFNFSKLCRYYRHDLEQKLPWKVRNFILWYGFPVLFQVVSFSVFNKLMCICLIYILVLLASAKSLLADIPRTWLGSRWIFLFQPFLVSSSFDHYSCNGG